MDRKMVKFMQEQYPPGTRIRLNSMSDPYSPVPAGIEGIVELVDDAGSIHMKWDNGRTLALIPGEDSFTLLPPRLETLKLYMPLTSDFYEPNEYGDLDENGVTLEGEELRGYESQIAAALNKYRMPEEAERGVMHWYDEADSVNRKVHSAVFTVEERNGQLWGNVTVKGRLLVWGGGTAAIFCNNGTNMSAVVVARVDDAVKVIYDRDSTLAVIDTIKVRITERAKQHKETEVIFYDVSDLREAQKQLNAIVADNQIDITAPAHLYALVGSNSVKAEFVNNSKSDTYKVEIRRNKDDTPIADAFELSAGKSISTLALLEAAEFGNVDCTVTITAFRDGKQIGSMQTELTFHIAYLWPKEVQ